MSNPWLKKNPFLSAWLSTAHRVLGSLRGTATAQAQRQVTAALNGTGLASPSPAVPKPVAKTQAKPEAKPKVKLATQSVARTAAKPQAKPKAKPKPALRRKR
jgi:hypothetical protein